MNNGPSVFTLPLFLDGIFGPIKLGQAGWVRSAREWISGQDADSILHNTDS